MFPPYPRILPLVAATLIGVTGPAFAQAAGPSPLSSLPLFVALIAIFYFFLIRPQQKKVKEHQAMVAALRRGDQIVTQGGLIAKVVKVKDDNEIEAEIADGVKVRIVRSTIVQVLNKTEPAS